MGIHIGQRREALGRDGEVMVTWRRGSVFVGSSGFEGKVRGSGHDCGREEDDGGGGLIEGADASLYEEPKRRRSVWRLASRGKKRYDIVSREKVHTQ